jgi:hypothetical protein
MVVLLTMIPFRPLATTVSTMVSTSSSSRSGATFRKIG